MKIGVFDSGIGGLSVAKAVEEAFPEHEIEFVSDRANLPYGTKTPDELLRLTSPILQDLATRCGLVVIACNTVTTTIISELREIISVPLIGLEPMIKPAAEQTKSGTIAVCATPATLGSPRYADLRHEYAERINIIEPDCSQWAVMIENDQIDKQIIRQQIEDVCVQGADVIVLGCTHYHWIEQLIEEAAHGRAKILQSEQAIVARVEQLAKER